MKNTKEQLKELQAHWYKLLADHGFRDIEKFKDGDFVLIDSMPRTYRDAEPIYRVAKEDYFRALGLMVQDEETIFRNEVDKVILTRHSEGAHIKSIVEELEELGLSRERKSVRIIIRRYEMAWKIRSYRPKQLNVKI